MILAIIEFGIYILIAVATIYIIKLILDKKNGRK